MTELKTLDKYELIEELGRGGFAVVYRAHDPTLDRDVALKIMQPMLLADPQFVASFEREAKAAASLDHPHIVTIYEVGQADNRQFIAMKYLPGGSLAERVREQGPLSLAQVTSLIESLAEALDYAHERGVTHRDIKPPNILFDAQGQAILTDFGLASAINTSYVGRSFAGGVAGTPAYIAPEVLDDQPASAASDLYALGCVAYEMLTGKVLYQRSNLMATLKAHSAPPDFAGGWLPGVPAQVEDVLRRCLATDPAARYATARAFAGALQGLADKPAGPPAQSGNSGPQAAGSWREEAERAIAAGEWAAAREAVARWLELAPNDPAALRARQIAEQNMLEEAAQPQGPPPGGPEELEPATEPAAPAPEQRVPQTQAPRQAAPPPAAKPARRALWGWVAILVVILGAASLLTRNLWQGGTPTPIIVEKEVPYTRIVKETVVVEKAVDISVTAAPQASAPTAEPPASAPSPTRALTHSPAAVVSHATLNLRSGPGEAYPVIANYAQGAAVRVLGQSVDGQWLKVEPPDGRQGWMWAAYLQVNVAMGAIQVAEAPPTPTKQPATDGMVLIPAGEFQMGCDERNPAEICRDDEKPLHTVFLASYYIDKYEVTNAEYAAFLDSRGNQDEGGSTWINAGRQTVRVHEREESWQASAGYEDHPVVEVSWYGARAYCAWAGKRLPTEAEWEKAARGSADVRKYPWGNEEPDCARANLGLAGIGMCMGDTTEVGSYPGGASPYGVLDMAGNVWEWVADWYGKEYYAESPRENPEGPVTGDSRVQRGGSWYLHYDRHSLRSAYRWGHHPGVRDYYVGFRCALSLGG